MVQVSVLPPPYSRENASFPPPLQDDNDNRAWAFQRAFEGARELVRYSVLNTFKVWAASWEFKGQDIPRDRIQFAYTYAPEDLKAAVEWQLQWDTATWMTSDWGRRCHEHFRKQDAGIEQTILTVEQFESEFSTAKPSVQQAVLRTVTSWLEHNYGINWPVPDHQTIKRDYEHAPPSLKGALSFILELNWEILPLESTAAVAEVKARYREMITRHRTEAHGWDAEGQARGLW